MGSDPELMSFRIQDGPRWARKGGSVTVRSGIWVKSTKLSPDSHDMSNMSDEFADLQHVSRLSLRLTRLFCYLHAYPSHVRNRD